MRGWLAEQDQDVVGGVVLLVATIVALILSNSPLAWAYDALLDTPVSVKVGAIGIDKPLLLWINDGLMAIFFFLIGLEIKRELLEGALSSRDRAILPAAAALGGMVVPALIYSALNAGNAVALKGWAIPTATDIAFAVGIVALLGKRVPPALKVFLLALAIIDDLGAIVVIAAFYTNDLSLLSLSLAAVGMVVLWILNRRQVSRLAPYLLVGLFIWICVLKSGVHATLAGVVVAFFLPLRTTEAPSLAEDVQHALHPWVMLGVAPLFAFANAGVSLAGVGISSVMAPIPLGIALGLLIGKPIGILGFAWIAIRLGLCDRPSQSSWLQLLGIAFLAGIGFTMSLFIGSLAFPDPARALDVRVGVLSGSILAAIIGYIILARAPGLAANTRSGPP
jgi:NhaA family Na+:H+ antiporter